MKKNKQNHFKAPRNNVYQPTGVQYKMESIMCHICNTYVPKQFLREHNISLKHKMYMEIANTALKRIKKEIHDEHYNEKIDVNESIYFCPDCVSIVNIKEKKNHEISLNHKNSVFLDNRLSDFLKLYSNNIEKVDNDPDTDEETNKILVSIEMSAQIKFEDATANFDLKSYLKILKDKYKMPMNVKFINKGCLEIEIEGSTVEVSSKHFYGFTESYVTSLGVQCVICSDIVNYEDIVTHLMETKHMYLVSKPMQDKHCTKEIYPYIYHCVLCNVIIGNYNYHTISDAVHNKRLQEALKSDAAKSVDNSTVSSENGTLVSDKNINNTHETSQKLKNVESKYNYMFKIESSRLSCIVCGVVFNETIDFETHINLDNHIKKYEELLTINKLQIQYNNDLFCGVCKEVVVTSFELSHINDSFHKQYLRDSENNTNQTKTKMYYCVDCGVQVPNNDYNIQSHNRGRLHLKNESKASTNKRSLYKNKFL